MVARNVTLTSINPRLDGAVGGDLACVVAVHASSPKQKTSLSDSPSPLHVHLRRHPSLRPTQKRAASKDPNAHLRYHPHASLPSRSGLRIQKWPHQDPSPSLSCRRLPYRRFYTNARPRGSNLPTCLGRGFPGLLQLSTIRRIAAMYQRGNGRRPCQQA